MTCRDVESMLDAYADRELEPAKTRAVRAHLGQCRACTGQLEGIEALRVALRRHLLPASPAPDVLRARVRRLLREEAERPAGRRAWSWRWAAAAAAVLLAAGAGVGLLARQRPSRHALIARDVLASHVRSLLPGHLTDVVSSDQHAVKPWFTGRLDYSPDVYDLDGAGYSLVGARLDYVGGRQVAAIVYRRRQHVINVFLWPASGKAKSHPAGGVNGYHVVHWTGDGMTCWAVSDLSVDELTQFARAWERADAADESSEEEPATPPAPGAASAPAR